MDILDKVKNIKIADFDYPLPDERIARHPLAARDSCLWRAIAELSPTVGLMHSRSCSRRIPCLCVTIRV